MFPSSSRQVGFRQERSGQRPAQSDGLIANDRRIVKRFICSKNDQYQMLYFQARKCSHLNHVMEIWYIIDAREHSNLNRTCHAPRYSTFPVYS